MKHRVRTERFDFEYTESENTDTLLWENHCHAQFEMICVVEGDIRIDLEGRSYRLTAKQTAIIPPLCYHTVSTNKKGQYRRMTVLFDVTAIPSALQKRFREMGSELPIFYSYPLTELQTICTCADPTFYEPLAESLMIQAFYEAIRAEQTQDGIHVDEFLQKILSYVDEHLCERISLDDLALYTAQSKSSVCHLFQEKMKISPKQYILQKKLALADKQIRDGTPPTVAAMQVGYDNYSNFYRMYRKHFGSTPAERKDKTPLR